MCIAATFAFRPHSGEAGGTDVTTLSLLWFIDMMYQQLLTLTVLLVSTWPLLSCSANQSIMDWFCKNPLHRNICSTWLKLAYPCLLSPIIYSSWSMTRIHSQDSLPEVLIHSWLHACLHDLHLTMFCC